MADQGKWFKLWCSATDDQDLENLGIHEWFCWARFGAYLKKHGRAGKIRLREPATAVVNVMRVNSFKDAVTMIKLFPNYIVEEPQNVTVQGRYTVSIKCKNWNKYQGDFSGDRVKKHRNTVTANVTAQEEKRREEKKKRIDNTFAPPTILELDNFSGQEGLNLDSGKFFDFYESKGWVVGRVKMKDWKAAARRAARDWAIKATGGVIR